MKDRTMVERMVGFLAVLAAMGVAACGGSAAVIARTASGGVLGLDGDRDQAMADARRLMSESCGGAYTIVGERNALAGVFHGRPLTEYQLRYLCGAHPDRQISPAGAP